MAERHSQNSSGFSVRPADNTADLMRMNVNKNYVKSVDNTFDLIRSNMISKTRVDSNSMTSQHGSMTSQMGPKPPMPKPNAASLADIDDPYADPYGGNSSYQPPRFGPPIPKPNKTAATHSISRDSGPYSFPVGQRSMDQGLPEAPVLPPMYSTYSVQTTQSFEKSAGSDVNPPFYSRSTYSASQTKAASQLSYNYPHK